jgi:hypothetical protein
LPHNADNGQIARRVECWHLTSAPSTSKLVATALPA